MAKQSYQHLKTTTGDFIEIGTQIRQEGAPPFANVPMKPIEGTVTKMEDCDSGIWIYVRTQEGTIDKAHMLYCIPFGLRMHNHGVITTIIKQAPQQLEIRA